MKFNIAGYTVEITKNPNSIFNPRPGKQDKFSCYPCYKDHGEHSGNCPCSCHEAKL
jgi:hypothetical protein